MGALISDFPSLADESRALAEMLETAAARLIVIHAKLV
jgi:hypothetical protein